MDNEWISANKARHFDIRSFPPGSGIIEYAAADLVTSRAVKIICGQSDSGLGEHALDAEFWRAVQQSPGLARWQQGQFTGRLRRGIRDGYVEIIAYGVEFGRASVLKYFGKESTTVQPGRGTVQTQGGPVQTVGDSVLSPSSDLESKSGPTKKAGGRPAGNAGKIHALFVLRLAAMTTEELQAITNDALGAMLLDEFRSVDAQPHGADNLSTWAKAMRDGVLDARK